MEEEKKEQEKAHIEHPISVKINEACLNGDEDCPCVRKVEKREYNPI